MVIVWIQTIHYHDIELRIMLNSGFGATGRSKVISKVSQGILHTQVSSLIVKAPLSTSFVMGNFPV